MKIGKLMKGIIGGGEDRLQGSCYNACISLMFEK